MTQLPQGLRYLSKILVALAWSFAGFWFTFATRGQLLISWIAPLPEWFSKTAISFVGSSGFMILCAMLFGLASLLIWRRSINKFVALSLAILIPVFFLCASFAYAMGDTQGVVQPIVESAQSGDLKNTREQLLIQSPSPSYAKTLIQLGTNVNARDPLGRSALYWASWQGKDPEILKLLLQSGAKPDAAALRNAISWGRLDAIQLMFNATSDDGKALVAELGDDALAANNVTTSTSKADREQIANLLKKRAY